MVGADEHRVEHLVVLVSLSRADIDELPLNVIGDWSQALKAHLELKGVVEPSGVIEHGDIGDADAGHCIQERRRPATHRDEQGAANTRLGKSGV